MPDWDDHELTFSEGIGIGADYPLSAVGLTQVIMLHSD